jgi:hypothetical protein
LFLSYINATFAETPKQLQGVIPASVQAHANWTKWKPETNILPQQEGFGLTLE